MKGTTIMKTKSFILTLVALIAFAGNAWAQKDITSQYIVNAKLTQSFNVGWTTTNFNGDHTQGNNTEGYAVESYAGWDAIERPSYSMKQNITLPAGRYRLVNYAFYRWGGAYNTDNNKSEAYLVAGDNRKLIVTLGSIEGQASYANSMIEAANRFDTKMYRNFLDFTIDADNTTISVGVEGTHTELKSWFICGMFELFDLDDEATVSSPTDMTYAITNPGFEYRNTSGWTNQGFAYVDNNDNIGGKSGVAYVEYYRGGGLEDNHFISQTLTNLNNGLYEVTVYGHQQQGTPNDGVKLYANDDYIFIGSTTQDYSVRTKVTNNELTIKIQTEGSTANWTAFDKFRLKYFGDPLQAYKDLLAEKVAEAQELVDGGTLRTGAANQLQTIINANDNDDNAFTTEEQFNTAVSNIEAGMAQANQIVAAYASFDTYKDLIDNLADGQPASQELTAFQNTLATLTTNVANATTVAAINDQITALRSAGLTYISTADGQFDITFLATQNWQEWRRYNGTSEGTNAGLLSDNFLHNRPAEIPSFPEYWVANATYTGKQLWQTVSGLPQGFYQVSMYAGALSTSQRDGFPTEASDGDSDRSFAFAGDENDASSIMRTGIPIKFATEVDFSELTILDVNVHLTGSDNSNNLTFGITKDSNGSNWHFAQIASIIYSNQPDLTQLEATRDALVAEAQGILNRDGGYLTDAQKTALQNAITAGNDANTFDNLNTVTLTTLPNAINTAKQQVAQAKAAIPVLHQALERFEKDYNLVDGTDYQRVTMSAKAWTDLLAKVNAATLALDDIFQAPQFATIADELNDQMDATDVSIRLFKSYKAMVQGCQSLNITEGDTYAADSYMDTDEKEMEAIAALNTAFISYREGQSNDVDMAGFLGDNLDFSATQGDLLVTGTLVYDLVGWEENYSDVQANERIQTNAENHNEELYLRSNWTDKNPVLEVAKLKMLPVGDYQLSLSWNSNMQNMQNHSKFVLGETGTTIGEATSGTLTYDFTVSDAATDFDLILGFQKQNTGNSGAEIIVDDIQLICLAGTPFQRAYDAAEAANDDTDATAAAKSAVTEYAQYDGNEGGLLTEGERGDAYWQAVNVLRNAKAIADASGDATDLVVNADLTNTNKNGNFPMGWTGTYEGDNPGGNAWIRTQDGEQVFNIWAANITLVDMMQAISNLPKGAYRLSMDMGTNNLPDNGDGAPVFNFINPVNMDIGASELVTADNTGEHRNFETYTSAAEVGDAHQLTIGVRSEGHYFQMKNIHLEYIGNAATAAAETDASYVRQDFFWQNKDADVVEFFFDGEKYENAQNVKVYPTGVNRIIHGLPGEFAASVPNADNGGTCENLIITDGYSLVNTKAFNATTASYTRNMSGSSLWGTLIMPFPLTSNDDIQYYTFNQFVEGEEETVMAFVPADEVPANTPVVYKKKDSEATSVTATGSGQVALTTGNQGDAMTLSGWNLIGVYEPTTIERNGHTPDRDGNYYYYIASNKFWKLNSDDKNDLTVAPFRAYFMTTNDVDLSSTQSIKIRVMDDDATGIIDLNDGIEICGDIYTVGGQLVRKNAHNFEGLQRGVYIVGGKKVVIK